jgi:hypothetical protein
MSDAHNQPPSSGLGAFFFTCIGCVLFVFIVRAAWIHHQPAAPGDGIHTDAQRAKTLLDLRAKEAAAAKNYGWIDQSKGIVRLPTDRAVALTIEELKAAQK